MKYLRLFLCLVALSLTACMSHILLDTSTRLQIENKTDVAILGLDIISEDGTSVRTWINETIEPGEKSKVVEEDWVGSFKVRVRFDKWSGIANATYCAKEIDVEVRPKVMVQALAKKSEPNVIITDDYGCSQEGNLHMVYTETTLDFEGGSQHLIVSQDEDGNVAFKLK